MKRIGIEMMNLMCIFDCSDRTALIKDIRASLPYISDGDMTDLMEQTIHVLENITDEEFSGIDFEPVWEESGDDADAKSV